MTKLYRLCRLSLLLNKFKMLKILQIRIIFCKWEAIYAVSRLEVGNLFQDLWERWLGTSESSSSILTRNLKVICSGTKGKKRSFLIRKSIFQKQNAFGLSSEYLATAKLCLVRSPRWGGLQPPEEAPCRNEHWPMAREVLCMEKMPSHALETTEPRHVVTKAHCDKL